MKNKKVILTMCMAVCLFTVVPKHTYATGGFWSEQIQGRIDLVGILTNASTVQPFIFANIFSLGFSLQPTNAPVMVDPYISFLVSGAFHYQEVDGNDGLLGSGGGGVALGARIRLWGYLSIKPELSGLILLGENYTYGIVEIASEVGLVLPNVGEWALCLDIFRIGVKPGDQSVPNLSLVLSPSIGVIKKW